MGIQMLFACYFFGAYWYVFCETMMIYIQETSDNTEEIHAWVNYEGSWNIIDRLTNLKIITCLYFATTTLSTVGFGDYYPVSNSERLIGAILLYFGQAGFNYLCSQLLTVLDNLKLLYVETDDSSDNLENFFNALKSFNHGHPLNAEFQT